MGFPIEPTGTYSAFGRVTGEARGVAMGGEYFGDEEQAPQNRRTKVVRRMVRYNASRRVEIFD